MTVTELIAALQAEVAKGNGDAEIVLGVDDRWSTACAVESEESYADGKVRVKIY